MNAILGSILENLKGIEIIEQPTLSVFTKDKLSTSDGRELTVKEFLGKYLPQDYVVKKGAIFSLTDSSNNIDCVVLSPSHPKLFTPIREIIIAEGVYAAVEVKPDISVLTDKGEFYRGLMQSKSVKKLLREVLFLNPKPDCFKKIPFVIFSLKGADSVSTIDYIIEKINDNTFVDDEIPDVIVQLDKGIIFYNPHISSTPFGEMMERKYPKEFFGEAGFIFIDTQDKGMILAIFLLLFLNLTPPQPQFNAFILSRYLLDASVYIGGDITMKFFPVNNPYGYDAYTKTWKVPNATKLLAIDSVAKRLAVEHGIDFALIKQQLLDRDN